MHLSLSLSLSLSVSLSLSLSLKTNRTCTVYRTYVYFKTLKNYLGFQSEIFPPQSDNLGRFHNEGLGFSQGLSNEIITSAVFSLKKRK